MRLTPLSARNLAMRLKGHHGTPWRRVMAKVCGDKFLLAPGVVLRHSRLSGYWLEPGDVSLLPLLVAVVGPPVG